MLPTILSNNITVTVAGVCTYVALCRFWNPDLNTPKFGACWNDRGSTGVNSKTCIATGLVEPAAYPVIVILQATAKEAAACYVIALGLQAEPTPRAWLGFE